MSLWCRYSIKGQNLTFYTIFKSRVMGIVTRAHCHQVILERGLKLRGIKLIKCYMALGLGIRGLDVEYPNLGRADVCGSHTRLVSPMLHSRM